MKPPSVFILGLCLFISSSLLVDGEEIGDDYDEDVVVETEPEEGDEEYQSPKIDSKNVYFSEHFDDINSFKNKWVKSSAMKQGVDEDIAKYNGKWELKEPIRRILKDDLGLVLTTEAKHAAISSMLERPFMFQDKPLIVQYEVTLQEGQNCGGAYLKLLSSETIKTKNDLKQFTDKTPYTIMFGPDKCGNDHKLHFIFRHKNPKNGSYEEKHSKKPSQRLDEIYKDKEPHLYTLIVNPDNTFVVKIDNKEVNSGSLLEDFTPAVNPPEEIDDPKDAKPENWDEREKIVDPTASKPDDWDENAPAQILDTSAVKPEGWLDDEPKMIPDKDAAKPDDWDVEMDGEWEPPMIDNPVCEQAPGCGPWSPPMIPNPDYKGIWRAPLIPNPNYKGKWTPRKIKNPDYFRDEKPFKMTPIYAVGFELWSMSPQLLFDNIIITDDVNTAVEWAEQTFKLKRNKLAKDSDSFLNWLVNTTNENPWLWAVYLIVGSATFGFLLYLCCGSSSDKSSDEVPLHPKKTDLETEDDPHDDEDEDGEDQEEAAESEDDNKQAGDTPGPSSKAELEKPLQETSDGSGDGHRKRKPRKE